MKRKTKPTRARSFSPAPPAGSTAPLAGSSVPAAPPPSVSPLRLLTLLSSAERKQYPMATGCLDYFPDALAAVSNVSFRGNEKHNPGQPLHWSRGKSNDHADCVMRHMVERGAVDAEGTEHLAQVAWRALADLQEHLENKYNLDMPRGSFVRGAELPPR